MSTAVVSSEPSLRGSTAERIDRVDPALELVLPATRESLAILRDAVQVFLTSPCTPPPCRELAPDLLLAVQEAASNVVRYAYPAADRPGRLQVSAAVEPHLVRIAVIDDGVAWRPETSARTPASPRPEGGLGLPLMRALMSKVVYFRRGGTNTLLLEKALPAPALTTP